MAEQENNIREAIPKCFKPGQKLKLQVPFEFEGIKYSEIEFKQRLRVEMVEGQVWGSYDKREDYYQAISGVTSLLEHAIDEMSVPDLDEIISIIYPNLIANMAIGEETIELPHRIELEERFKLGEKLYSEVMIKKPLTSGMIKKISLTSPMLYKDFYSICAGMTELPTLVFQFMSPCDFNRMVSVIIPFITSGTTGNTT